MTVSTDPRYRTLAALAMQELGVGGNQIQLAIVSQWQCEQPANAWPPVHNNPGYVTVGAMRSVGEPATPATSSPGPGFLAQYATPEDGARAYGRLIARGARYAATRAQAQANHGLGYLNQITTAKYGTRYSCCRPVFLKLIGAPGAGVTGVATPPPAAKPPTGIVLAVYDVVPAATCTQVTILVPGNSTETRIIPVPRESIADPCTVCPTGWNKAVVTVGPIQALQGFVPPEQLPPGTGNACVAGDVKVGDNPGFDQGAGAIGATFAGLGAAIFEGLAPLAWLVGFLVLILLGLYIALKD